MRFMCAYFFGFTSLFGASSLAIFTGGGGVLGVCTAGGAGSKAEEASLSGLVYSLLPFKFGSFFLS